MKIEVNEDYSITLKDVFNGVRFETKEGEKISVCMRDGGFEVSVKDMSVISDDEYYDTYRIKNGIVERLLSDKGEAVMNLFID